MTTTSEARRGRAKPMSVDERREAIARATLPLLMAHGRDVTTRQIAEAAGVAEGTLFRVYESKDAIVDAAVAAYLEPGPFRAELRRIDPALPLELKVRMIIDRFHDRFTGIFGVFAALGTHPRPPVDVNVDAIVAIFSELLEPELERLRVPPATVFAFVRVVAFASALPHFSSTISLDSAELASLVCRGIANDPPHPADTSSALADRPTTERSELCS
ncbi:TetR/AcrR family transcriptional regulator [Agromyces mediolanus]|uniref:TetR/AcrR family transcriptional regulator n=1 Tax=Agromyces mediolanus TaxID=41986 RepID=UPI0020419631|nr:TetR/AcrR family transcriptional regulator [Agromyces mediolanus]MCM3656117.1 TetR/AcrR family transcriptional regulator [Agromyces mediolanus]